MVPSLHALCLQEKDEIRTRPGTKTTPITIQGLRTKKEEVEGENGRKRKAIRKIFLS
jgi:hypothetical protein